MLLFKGLHDIVGQLLHVGQITTVHAAHDGDGRLNESDVLHLLDEALHGAGGARNPRSVLEQGYATLLISLDGELIKECVHGGEHAGVVTGGATEQRSVAESILHILSHIGAAEVGDSYLGAAALQLQLAHLLGSGSRTTMGRGVSDEHTRRFHLIVSPNVIKAKRLLHGLVFEHRAMKWANGFYST